MTTPTAAHSRARDLPHAAWIIAYAYTRTAVNKDGTRRLHHPRRWAVVTYPLILLMLLGAGPRSVYLTNSRTGTVVITSTLRYMGRVAVAMAVLIVITIGALFVVPPLGAAIQAGVRVAIALSIVTGAAFLWSNGHRTGALAEAAPTVKGRRGEPWVQVAALAALPGGGLGEALLMAQRAVHAQKPGTVVSVEPRTARLRALYERAGFAPSGRRHMILRVPGGDQAQRSWLMSMPNFVRTSITKFR